jgi:hypothetical protein
MNGAHECLPVLRQSLDSVTLHHRLDTLGIDKTKIAQCR